MPVPTLPAWEVTLQVYGPITVEREYNFLQRKDFHYDEKLYSEIKIIKNDKSGVTIRLTAYATEQIIAKKAALYFCGQALDVLSSTINLQTILALSDSDNISPKKENERRRVTEDEFTDAFRTARLWLLTEPTFLRAVGWYRKGLYTEDPFDKFLAFYNSIETICSKYNPKPEACTGKGSKCHMWETFKSLWGECEEWPIIPNQTSWIDFNYETRKEIAHGIASIEINVIEAVIAKLDPIKHLAFQLISDWKHRLDPKITDDIRSKLL